MNNEKKDYQAAVLVHECLRARTDCFGNDGKIVKTAYIVCIDDDPDSAIHAVRLARLLPEDAVRRQQRAFEPLDAQDDRRRTP